jgi:hypothetical protein
MIEPVDLIDEENISRLQAGENSCQISGTLNHRARGDLDAGPHFIGDDVSKRGLAQTGEAMKKDMVQRFAPLQGCLDKNAQALLYLVLTDILIQPARPDFNPDLKVLLLFSSGNNPFTGQILFVFHLIRWR